MCCRPFSNRNLCFESIIWKADSTHKVVLNANSLENDFIKKSFDFCILSGVSTAGSRFSLLNIRSGSTFLSRELDLDPNSLSPDPEKLNSDPDNLYPDPDNLNLDPDNLNPDPDNLNPDPVNPTPDPQPCCGGN